jgi:hypothetical protein
MLLPVVVHHHRQRRKQRRRRHRNRGGVRQCISKQERTMFFLQLRMGWENDGDQCLKMSRLRTPPVEAEEGGGINRDRN